MLADMNRSCPASAVRVLAGAVAVLALAGGCTSTPPSQGTGTPTVTTPSSTPSTVATTTAPAIPTYTPPPGRGLTRPPGVAPVRGAPCDPAVTDEHFYEVGWYGSFASYGENGEQVPDSQWQGAEQNLQTFLDGTGKARAALRAAGVPTSYPAYRDLTELDRAMREGIAVVRARDDSKVLPVYFALKTAHDHLLESCSALER